MGKEVEILDLVHLALYEDLDFVFVEQNLLFELGHDRVELLVDLHEVLTRHGGQSAVVRRDY